MTEGTRNRRLRAGALALTTAATLFAATPVWADFESQPANENSSLVDASKRKENFLTDKKLADKLKGALTKPDGSSNVQGAVTLFQQCYGGGFLDDMKSAMGDKVRWQGGAASKHNEESWGTGAGTAYWMNELLKALGGNKSLNAAIKTAKAKDGAGVNGGVKKDGKTHQETGQETSSNKGHEIQLKERAQSYHAIIWTGTSDATDMNIANQVRNSLQSNWRGLAPANKQSITMVNTEATLDAELRRLKPLLNPNELFVFVAVDHGANSAKTGGAPVNPGSTESKPRRMSEGALDGMRHTSDNTPTLLLQHGQTSGATSVLINGTPIGSLNPNGTETLLEVPESLIVAENLIAVENHGLSTLDWIDAELDTGAIEMPVGEVIPEPGSAAGLAVAGLAFQSLYLRRRR